MQLAKFIKKAIVDGETTNYFHLLNSLQKKRTIGFSIVLNLCFFGLLLMLLDEGFCFSIDRFEVAALLL